MPVGLQVKIGADVTGLTGALQAAAGGAGSFGEALKATVAQMNPAAAAGIAVADALVGMTEAAAADRDEQTKLNQLYADATGVTGDYTGAINAAIDAGAAKAFSDSEVREGLTGLITATGDADEANKLLAAAMDISRAAGVPLAQAADAVAKAHAGQDTALRKLFPGMGKQATAADTITEATKLSSGAADDYAKSAEGMSKQGQDAFGELSETIGSAFLPIMDELLPALLPFVELLGELITAVMPLLKPAIDIIVGALRILIEVLSAVVDGIKTVMGFINDLVNRFKDAANLVGSIDLNPFSVAGMPSPEMAGYSRSGRSGGSAGGGGTTVNVNVSSADPSEVVRAIRRWSRNNGGSGPFNRGLDRSTA